MRCTAISHVNPFVSTTTTFLQPKGDGGIGHSGNAVIAGIVHQEKNLHDPSSGEIADPPR